MEISKSELRKSLIAKRSGLSTKSVEEKSRQIAKKMMESDLFLKTKIVSAYLPIRGEVSTKPIINFLIEAGVEVYLPKSFGEEYKLVRFKSWNDLEKGPYGILEPLSPSHPEFSSGSKKMLKQVQHDKVDIDLAFIPGVAFDKNGVRLGYGKGVFDRLFAKSEATLVGLAYEFQIVDELPREEHDLVMDYVVTPSSVILSGAKDL
ncbi:5-formyltetrahydrofolate cyclo-ligase [Candidatus Curtissbacteria bacterium]|nr:5-formyltetrahydrofolate cyclo-ligase [Candidatus Curtissbacteria bacterium]